MPSILNIKKNIYPNSNTGTKTIHSKLQRDMLQFSFMGLVEKRKDKVRRLFSELQL